MAPLEVGEQTLVKATLRDASVLSDGTGITLKGSAAERGKPIQVVKRECSAVGVANGTGPCRGCPPRSGKRSALYPLGRSGIDSDPELIGSSGQVGCPRL
jgi:hypothetical protein